MSTIDLQNLFKISEELSSSGKPLPYWLEEALRKAKHDSKLDLYAQQKQIEEANSKQQPYQSRIDNLFNDFDNSLPDDFKKLKTSELETALDTTKHNIKQFAADMHRLSDLAGQNPALEDKAVKITSNLLDRLKNDLELIPQEKKQLEGKSFEEVAEYYSQTRSGKMDKLNNSINNYRQELHQLENSSQDKSQVEILRIYEEKLLKIERATGQGKIEDKISESRLSKYEATLDNIKSPPQNSQNILDKQLEQNTNEKSAFSSSLFN